ncbi:12246_t:CDS:2 [Dentiscutata heterogama]|uniref:12246_t:CDS:1 n=1 Tax=Dentiscutata heterogama TaxID=1316150 RepID=A0ACA9L5Z8_9GLOM|nr:12246_t:CDS:2 [Dentiscutata heterogama]
MSNHQTESPQDNIDNLELGGSPQDGTDDIQLGIPPQGVESYNYYLLQPDYFSFYGYYPDNYQSPNFTQENRADTAIDQGGPIRSSNSDSRRQRRTSSLPYVGNRRVNNRDRGRKYGCDQCSYRCQYPYQLENHLEKEH